MTQSYIQVLQALESFASAHEGVKRFHSDFAEQMNNFSTTGETFPVIYVEPLDNNYLLNTTEYNVRIYCFDRLQKDRSNRNLVLDNCDFILQGLVKWFGEENSDIPIQITSTNKAQTMNNATLDYCAGWYIDCTIEVDSFGICEIPFTNTPVISGYTCDVFYTNDYLTCGDLPVCSTIIDIQSDIAALSAATSGITATGAYLPLSGGTVTGNTDFTAVLLSGGTPLSSVIYNIAAGFSGGTSGNLWSASTGSNSIIANNGSGNIAGNFTVVAGQNNNANGSAYSVIAGGKNNVSTTVNNTFIGSGYGNSATTSNANIVGGANNSANGDKSIIGAGANNIVTTNYTSILGGRSNTANSNYATAVGGRYNKASNTSTFVGGGENNQASGYRSSVVAGKSNSATTTDSSILGGYKNITSGYMSVVLGGAGNIASGNNAAVINGGIVGGYYFNTASGNFSLIGNGQANQASGQFSTVVGGYYNIASASFASVLGGNYNTASAYGAMAAGQNNQAKQQFSLAIAGKANTADGIYSAIIGGVSNNVSNTNSGIFAGRANTLTGAYSAVIGGFNIAGTNAHTVYVPTLNAKSGATVNGSGVTVNIVGGGNVIISGQTGQPSIYLNQAGLPLTLSNYALLGSSTTDTYLNAVDHVYFTRSGSLIGDYQNSRWNFNVNIQPNTNNTFDIGTPALKWANYYGINVSATSINAQTLTATTLSASTYYSGSTPLSSIITSIVTGSTISGAFLNLSGGTLSGALYTNAVYPVATNTYNLGDASARWANSYFNAINILNGVGYEIYFNGAGSANIYQSNSGSDIYLNTNSGNIYLGNSDGATTLAVKGTTVYANELTATTVTASTLYVSGREYGLVISGNANSVQTLDSSTTNYWDYTLTANTTFTFQNTNNGQTNTVVVHQNGTTSGYTTTFSSTTSTLLWAGGLTPIGTATTGKTDVYTFVKTNGVMYGSVIYNF